MAETQIPIVRPKRAKASGLATAARPNARFFKQPTLDVARQLLGMKLCTNTRGVKTAGVIVEVEAYHGLTDEACHCYYRRTPRNEVMFWEPGYWYVYFIYGMHFCVNLVTEARDTGAAVLIRAIQPIEGEEAMRRRRKNIAGNAITNGPSKVCQALGIGKGMLGEYAPNSQRIWLEHGQAVAQKEIVAGPRIGISKSVDLPWRFYIRNNSWVSR